jgi:hypothetical protein
MRVPIVLALLAFSATGLLAQGTPTTVVGPFVTKEPTSNGGGNKAECPSDSYASALQIVKDPDQTRSINVWCTQKPSATKICAPFVPNMWRTVTPVPSAWSLEDCRNMGQAVGASTLQVGCFFDNVPNGQTQKYVFGGSSGIANPPTSGNVPSPNCGW